MGGREKFLRVAGAVFGAVVSGVLVFLLVVQVRGIPKYTPYKLETRVEITPERVARGRTFANALCAGCHLDASTQKLTGRQMKDGPPEFGTIVSRNITRHPERGVGRWTDGELLVFLRTGVRPDGQYVPPYMVKLPNMADEDLFSIVAFMRSDDPLVEASDAVPPGTTTPTFLTKFLSHVAFKPLPYPEKPITAPPRSDAVSYGRYLVTGALDCYGCHSADFATMDVANPEKSKGFMGGGNVLYDLDGRPVRSANLTPDDETGIGRWSAADFRRAMKDGFRPDRSVVRYPMVTLDLTDEDFDAMFAYLRSLPKLRNPVPREPGLGASNDPGAIAYHRYGCVSCHAETGAGIADLRQASLHFPEDADLEAWIRNPSKRKPGTRMPAWEGIIAESDYEPLVHYVRTLANKTN